MIDKLESLSYNVNMSTYKIIEGLPKDVELEVCLQLSQGWKCNGELFHRQVDGNNISQSKA